MAFDVTLARLRSSFMACACLNRGVPITVDLAWYGTNPNSNYDQPPVWIGRGVIKKRAPPRGTQKAEHEKCPGGHTQLLLGQLGHAGFKSEVSFFCNSPVLFLEQPRQRPSHGIKKKGNRPAVCLRLWELDGCIPLAQRRR